MDHVTLRLDGIWRYPVKTLAGEPLSVAEVTESGIVGDRVVHVRGPEGIRTSRRYHRLLGLKGTLSPDGEVLVNGIPWRDYEVLELIRKAAGEDAWLEQSSQDDRFDILPLLVATDGAVKEFGRDVRRLRPNIVVGGTVGLEETTWPGSELRIGDASIYLDSLRPRQ